MTEKDIKKIEIVGNDPKNIAARIIKETSDKKVKDIEIEFNIDSNETK